MAENNSRRRETDEGQFGRLCIFSVRLFGILSSIFILLCGFVALLPIPSLTTTFFSVRCLGVGFIFIVAAVAMFFLEASVLGYCVDNLKFLLVISKYLKHWQRAVFYMGISIAPLVLWCLSVSTILGMIMLLVIGALNFVIAIGQKGDHSQQIVATARWKRLAQDEEENEDVNSDEEKQTETAQDGEAREPSKLTQSDTATV